MLLFLTIVCGRVGSAPDSVKTFALTVTLRNFKLHLLETGRRNPLTNIPDLDANDLILVVKIEHDARLHFLGLYDTRIVDPEIKRVGFLVEMNFHSLFL
jgi:hypothetical protein